MRTFLLAWLLLLLTGAVWSQPSPQWATMAPDQQKFLLEAFSLPESQMATFNSNVPNDVKQGLLDSIWNVLTPEKRIQVLLYAHLEKPFSNNSNNTSQVNAPEFDRLSKYQKAKVYEAMHWDGNQRKLWESMLPPLRQAAFETMWSYLSPEARRAILKKA